ncbi:MAG: hypothetical protein IOMNBAOH_00392 [Rhodocyclaceae bacterium]|nr:hypothetical protein [Rhodocyclaceae bacterium]
MFSRQRHAYGLAAGLGGGDLIRIAFLDRERPTGLRQQSCPP